MKKRGFLWHLKLPKMVTSLELLFPVNCLNPLLKKWKFEDIVIAIKNERILDFIESPTHENQSCFVVDFNGYAYIIPFVQKDENTIFLKTIYPSRKHTKFYNLKD